MVILGLCGINKALSYWNLMNRAVYVTVTSQLRSSYQYTPIDTYENRFIKRSTPFGEINLIYLKNFMNLICMNEEFPPYSSFASTPKRCKTDECNNRTEDAFQGNLNETLSNILPQLNAMHAFISLGWEDNFPFVNQSDFSCTMREFERHHPDIKLTGFLLWHQYWGHFWGPFYVGISPSKIGLRAPY
jgi:hypothetical protein